jgi:hypothetical protein
MKTHCVGEAVVGYALVIYYWSNEYGGDIACIYSRHGFSPVTNRHLFRRLRRGE